MKAKPIITALLLAFVAVSIGYLVLRDNKTSAASTPTTSVLSPTGPFVPAAVAKPAAATPFVAYYFHSTKRCRTCMKIQAQSEEAITTALGEELKAGRLAWRLVNIEEAGNEHFATEYKVTGSTLVIAEVKEGKPVRFNKLDKTWDLVHDKPQFVDYVAREVLAFLGAGK
jgi:hypothetical protein